MSKKLLCEKCNEVTDHTSVAIVNILTARTKTKLQHYCCGKCKKINIIRKEIFYEKQILDG